MFRRNSTVTSGPIPLVFALLVLYFFEVPALSSLRIFRSLQMSEKGIVYLGAAQVRLTTASSFLSTLVLTLLFVLIVFDAAGVFARSRRRHPRRERLAGGPAVA